MSELGLKGFLRWTGLIMLILLAGRLPAGQAGSLAFLSTEAKRRRLKRDEG